MSCNRYQPHFLILPEDQANYDIANGFSKQLNVNYRAMQVLRFAGGWTSVLEEFKKTHVPQMQKYPQCRMLLLIDFDNRQDRFSDVEEAIPEDLKNRVFVLGVQSTPEELKQNLQLTFEKIGESLAQDCSDNTNQLWGHELLQHNEPEVQRMITSVKPYLFS